MDTQPVAYDVLRCLPENDGSVSLARQFTRETLVGCAFEGSAEDVVLVVSELVTNAVRHGHGAPVLRLVGTPWQVRVEVTDDSPLLPTARESGADGGWGLKLVERLSTGWGVSRPDRGGKVVWCELAAANDPARDAVA